MEAYNQTSDFIELHWVKKLDFKAGLPIIVNKRQVQTAYDYEMKLKYLTVGAKVELVGDNNYIFVTETYEEVKKMLMD